MEMTPDLGHAILTGLVGLIIYFLQRELGRNEEMRKEAISLVKNCNERLEGHERRLNVHGTDNKLLEQRVVWLESEVKALQIKLEHREVG